MSARTLIAASLCLTSVAFAGPAKKRVDGPAKKGFDQCKTGQMEVVNCVHATGRAGYSVQISHCLTGRYLAKLMGPGQADGATQLDAIEVKFFEGPAAREGGWKSWLNDEKQFDLTADFDTRLPHPGTLKLNKTKVPAGDWRTHKPDRDWRSTKTSESYAMKCTPSR